MDRMVLKGVVTKSEGSRYRGKASTSSVDRSGEIVLPAAFKNVGEWVARNPVMFYDHAWTTSFTVSESTLPIGKAVGAELTDKELMIDFEFSDLPFAQQVKSLVDGGFLNSLSVGFLPRKWDVNSEGQRVYTDVELLEVSVVGIPANAEATITRSAKEGLAKLASMYDELKSGHAAEGEERGSEAGAHSVEPRGAPTIFERRTIAKHMAG